MDITAANEGDEAFTFELMGVEHTIAAGESQTVTVPLQEDQAYDFTIKGPNGYEKRFKGVLDCRTQGSAAGETTQTLNEPSPATVGGTSATTVDLAETGASSSTPVIAGIAIGLVVIGGAAVLFVRKKKTPGAGLKGCGARRRRHLDNWTVGNRSLTRALRRPSRPVPCARGSRPARRARSRAAITEPHRPAASAARKLRAGRALRPVCAGRRRPIRTSRRRPP